VTGGTHTENWSKVCLTLGPPYTEILGGAACRKKGLLLTGYIPNVCSRARRRGRTRASYWRVRNECEKINKGIRDLADGDERSFRNSLRFAGRLKLTVWYMKLITLQSMYWLKTFATKYRTKSGLVAIHYTCY